jgi:hypothetical protein
VDEERSFINTPLPAHTRDHTNQGEELFGDKLQTVVANTVRIVGLNVNGIPKSGGTNDKLPHLFNYMADLRIDALCLQETNTQWHLRDPDERLPVICHGWFRSVKTISAWNTKTRSKEKYL